MTDDLAKMLADAKAFVSGDDANSIRMPKYLMEAYEDVKGTGLKLEEERAAHIDCHVKLHEKARAIIALIERLDRAETALRNLEQAESRYRDYHDSCGGGSLASGMAWDSMRRAGDLARAALTAEESK